ncbi:MAG: hypothetical protein ACD_3C00125G0008 [uncultured bacterium (gcode 4)]|uniref:Uncharacterized protein n=1 Tax=uncultured bacterium (gcode 4) TaxID=1234023 RepID=K2GCF0_9BACT|nr:MAG: hypothetical protein ACD_3C00125G0008 [uncultured bacterium (gcode 4)]
MQKSISVRINEVCLKEDTACVLAFIKERKKELEKMAATYQKKDVVETAVILVRLYADFENLVHEKELDVKTLENQVYVLVLLQKEIDYKEGRLKNAMAFRTRDDGITNPIALDNPRLKEVYDDMLSRTSLFKSNIEEYFDYAWLGRFKDKFLQIIFEWYSDKKNENLEVWITEAMRSMYEFHAKFCAFQYAMAFSQGKWIVYAMRILDMNILKGSLVKADLKNTIVNLQDWIESAVNEFDNRIDYGSRHLYFFWLIKEFHEIMNWKKMMTQSKGAMFSPEVVWQIRERVAEIGAFCWNPPLFD